MPGGNAIGRVRGTSKSATMTILLWILLILAVAVLLTIGSPIRFGAAASFGKSDRVTGRFWLSYIHPSLFIYEYSSREHKERMLIFGINPKWFRWKKRNRKDTAGQDNTDKTVNTQNDSANNANDGDTLMTKTLRRMEHIKDDPIYTKTVNKLNDIRIGLSHSYLKDRVFRKKLFKWLKRALNCTLTTVRFDKLKLRASVGFKNPAQTGKMYGYFTSVKSAISQRSKKNVVSMELEPVFTEKRLESDMEFVCRTSMAIITSNALTMALTFPYRRTKKRG